MVLKRVFNDVRLGYGSFIVASSKVLLIRVVLNESAGDVRLQVRVGW